jgi:hypothetical protein
MGQQVTAWLLTHQRPTGCQVMVLQRCSARSANQECGSQSLSAYARAKNEQAKNEQHNAVQSVFPAIAFHSEIR